MEHAPAPPETLGLYVHIPWCIRKCPYCDFNSHELRGSLTESEYTECLLRDLDVERGRTRGAITTVYFGGGTPSLFSPNSFQQILSHPAMAQVEEVTMEANPGAVEHQALSEYRAAGINRLSLGIQSLHAASLRKLGRIHSAQEAIDAVEAAKKAGFNSVNVDMMFGLPDQSIEMAMQDLDTLISFETSHISWYQLTIEPNTVFGKCPPVVASDDERADMSDAGLERLATAGFQQYEVSAFALEDGGFECKHNLNYWQFGDYLGIGAGAHGKVTLDNGSIVRTQKTRRPEDYMQEAKTQVKAIDKDELAIEFMMNALRLNTGTESELFTHRTGLSIGVLEPTLGELRRNGFMSSDKIALTDFGRNHLNSVVEKFL